MTELPAPDRTCKLGSSDIMVSTIAWGMWRFSGNDVAAATKRVETALDAGITLFDTADIYGLDNAEPFGAAEQLLGQVFAHQPGLARKMVIATKGGIVPGVPYNSSADYLRDAIDASLTRMKLEQVQLWQIHRPDMLTHPAEAARALEDAHRDGKIATIGVSNHSPAQVSALRQHLKLPIVSTQPEFSLLHLGPLFDGVLDQAMEYGMAVLAWSPLGGGRLADPDDARAQAIVALLDQKAEEAGVDRASAAFSWIMAHPARPIPIIGTQNIERIGAIPDAYKPRWTRAEWYALLTASMGEALP